MNNKGFTLVEILSVIVLIGLIIGIGIPGISRISDNMKQKSLNTKIKLVEEAGVFWGQDNKSMLQSDNNCLTDDGNVPCKKISIKELISEDYLDSEDYNDVVYTNPYDGNSMLNNYVYVYKKNNRVYAKYSEELSIVPVPMYSLNKENSKIKITLSNNSLYSNVYDIYYKENNGGWSVYSSEFEINVDDILLIKQCSKANLNKCSEEKILNGFLVQSSDGKDINDVHLNEFNINILVPENIEVKYKWEDEEEYNLYSNSIKVEESINKKLIIKIGEKELYYDIKLDKSPIINSFKVEYDYSNSYPTLTGRATDDLGFIAYQFTTDDTCPDSNWLNGENLKSLNKIFSLNTTFNGKYYFCVKDLKGEVQKKAINIANCKIDIDSSCSSNYNSSTYIFDNSYLINFKNKTNLYNLSVKITTNGSSKRINVQSRDYSFSLLTHSSQGCSNLSFTISYEGNVCYEYYS